MSAVDVNEQSTEPIVTDETVTLLDKIQAAITLIRETWGPNCAVMSSFGKDAMVMLDLFARAGIRPTILFFHEAFFPKKYAFAHRIIAERDYTVYNFLPFAAAPNKSRGKFEIVNYYQFGSGVVSTLLDLTPPVPGQPYLCALNDLLRRPLGTANVPWRTLYLGHKASDVDAVHGPIPIMQDVVDALDGMRAVFPLRTFTDADIWAYHKLRNLPVHTERYKPDGTEWEDRTYNPDRIPACCACFDRDDEEAAAAGEVFCPKLQKRIPYVGAQVLYAGSLPDYIKSDEEEKPNG